MAVQFSVPVRNGRLDSFEVTTGVSAVMRLFTTAPPANCAAADSGTILAELTLPVDWMNAAAGGAKTLNGTWQDLTANNSGAFGHFRVYESTITTCHMQGTAGVAGDMVTSAASVTAGDQFDVVTFTLTDGNA